MNSSRVDTIIQFALAVAARADEPRDRELGPIHLIKYVYLADLAFATANQGATYTGAAWRFYKFGPWSEQINGRIDAATMAINAKARTASWSKKGREGELIRYSVEDDKRYGDLEKQLDFRVASAIKRSVRNYYGDTSELLHHVYLTPPMLQAAPHDDLDFEPHKEATPAEEPATAKITARQRKKQQQRVGAAQTRVREKLAARRASKKRASAYTPAPRYDEVYEKGLEWLDRLAGDELPPDGDLEFAGDLWKSRSRYDPDLPD